MTSEMRIAKPLPFSATTGSSFDRELRVILWERCLRVTIIGLVISIIFNLVGAFLIEHVPEGLGSSSIWMPLMKFGHAGSFGVALVMLLLMRRWLCHLKLMMFAFALLAFNIWLAVFTKGICNPSDHAFFEVALLLFLPASFIPWRVGFQVALGIVALAAYVGTEIYYVNLPEYSAFWSERGGLDAFIDHAIWGTTGTAILGAVGVIASKTLYSLRKTVHQAQRLGNYLIERELGHGGMGTVYLAQHALICRPTAVKVMQAPVGESQTALARFEQEVRLSAHLTHPNTISIYDYGRTGDNVFYYAMEYLDGMDLQAFVERFGPLSPARVIYVLLQVCGSLAEAHVRGIVHRDIKPSNIFLTQRGGLCDYVKVLDFGLAKKVTTGDSSGLTKAGILFGTPRYIAPEAIYGQEPSDARADLYNLGGVAYWLLTGQPPFTSDSSLELIVDHAKTIPLRPAEVCETPLPAALDDIVMKCLKKKPEERFGSAEELAEALRQVNIDTPWSESKAREWWELHNLLEEMVQCEEAVEAV